MLSPDICDRCWKSKYDVSGELPGNLPWQCALDFKLIVAIGDSPPRGCYKIFEQSVYSAVTMMSKEEKC
jgi:hypothetical protein